MKIGDRVRNRGFWKKWTGKIIARNGRTLLIQKDSVRSQRMEQVWYFVHELKLLSDSR